MSRIEELKNRYKVCYYCGCKLTKQNKTIDHKIPLARGGSNSTSNFVVSCFKCNNEKADMTHLEYFNFKKGKYKDLPSDIKKTRNQQEFLERAKRDSKIRTNISSKKSSFDKINKLFEKLEEEKRRAKCEKK